MKIKKIEHIIIAILSILLILIIVTGCMQYYDLQWYKEQWKREKARADEYYELYWSLGGDLKNESKNNSSTSEVKETVYWLSSGSVYHLYRDCQYIEGKTVKSGTITASGKARCCSVCSDR